MDDKEAAGLRLLFGFIGIIIGILAFLYSGWALTILWSWFVVPLGIVPISFGLSLGIVVIFALIRQSDSITLAQIKNKTNDETDIVLNTLIDPFGSILHTTFMLLLGVLVNAIFL